MKKLLQKISQNRPLSFIILLCCSLSSAFAQDQMKMSPADHEQHSLHSQNTYPDLLIENARAKSTIPGVKVSAGYMKLTNNSNKTMRFVAAKSNAAKYTELHTMTMDNSKMVMRKVDAIEIKPQQSFIFKPKAYHLMFMGLNQRFKPGESITVTLIRDNGQTYDILLPIMAMQAH